MWKLRRIGVLAFPAVAALALAFLVPGAPPAEAVERGAQTQGAVKKKVRARRARRARRTARRVSPRKLRIKQANRGTVGIISGGFGGTYLHITADLAAVLNDGDKMRILPIVGQGSVQNIDDILYLKGVDVGIVQSDVLAHIKSAGKHPGIEERIHYVAKLFNDEFHLVAGKDIRSIEDLAGKKVSFGVRGSGTFITASAVFESFGIEVVPVHYDPALAFAKVGNGEIAAAAYVSGKPADALAGLKASDGYHLLKVDYAKPLRDVYLPARFTHTDYPGLVEKGTRVASISVGTVMAVYNWSPKARSRYDKVERFVEVFFSRHQELKTAARHNKWRELNIAATVPGWQRFAPAQRKLEKLMKQSRLRRSGAAMER